MQSLVDARTAVGAAERSLLEEVTVAVQAAGDHLLSLFTGSAQLPTIEAIAAAIRTHDEESLQVLRPRLEHARPTAGWVQDELAQGELPAGEWWITDPVEGAINFVHGMDEWAVTATLVRDNSPVLAVVYLPMTGITYTAVRGGGAFQDGIRLHVSAKTQLSAALVGTGQASPRETGETFALLGRSLTAMLHSAGVVRVSVPATLQLIHVAAGRMDAFWQHSAVRSGLVAGALLVQEAGGSVTDLAGRPWSVAGTDFLATAPGLQTAAVRVLTAATP